MTDSRDIVVAIDQGTSSTKVIAVDAGGQIVASASVAVGQHHPAPGWVEQDPEEILSSVVSATERAILGIEARVRAIAISSQRESAVLWDNASGRALGPMLGWQDRRTAQSARELTAHGYAETVHRISGLPIDPMFSALKFAWLLDQADPGRDRASAGELTLGTVDSWLVSRLTGDRRIEAGNASRTQLVDLGSADWSPELLEIFRIPRPSLPTVVPSDLPTAPVAGIAGLPDDVRIHAVLGDSHAALFGHGARSPGAYKVTYGTGSSIMGLASDNNREVPGLVRTIAWQRGNDVAHALEGNILSTGATLVWLSDILGISPSELAALAETAPEDHTVSLVPAFSGLGAPWWDDDAKGLLVGIELGSSRAVLARAAMESITLQIEDVLTAADGAGVRVETIHADGGPSANPWLMQLQADISGRTVIRSTVSELSALGAALFAGIHSGLWSEEDASAFHNAGARFAPHEQSDAIRATRERWRDALERARHHSRPDDHPANSAELNNSAVRA